MGFPRGTGRGQAEWEVAMFSLQHLLPSSAFFFLRGFLGFSF